MRRSALLPFLMLSTAALAEGQPSLIWLDMPRGKVSIEINGVEGNENGHGLVVHAGGDKEALIDSESLPDVVTKSGDSVLLRVFTGGNACPAMYAWLTYDREGLRATPTFGTCAEDGELVPGTGHPAFVLDKLGNGPGKIRYDYDGRTVRETAIRAGRK